MEEAGNVVRKKEPTSDSPLKVLLDARKIEEGGIGTYIRNLICGLSATGSVDLSILCDPERAFAVGVDESVKVIPENARRYSVDEYLFMPARISFREYDVFHVPHYTLPFRVPIPTVITVHDLIHVYSPERFYYPMLVRPLIRSALTRATRVVTVSEASYQQIKKFVKQDLAIVTKLRVVPNAVDVNLIKKSLPDDNAAGQSARKGDYFLAVFSNSKPHKGLDDLLESYRDLRGEKPVRKEAAVNKRLVLVGPGTEHIKGMNFGAEPGSPVEIIALGQVSQEALRRLYAHAAALIVPSTAEGFCLPVLEAHALGIPVIARPVPAVLELITSYDIVCYDFSKEALKAAIVQFLSGAARGLSNPNELKEQVERFAPRAAADGMCAIYSEAISAFSGDAA